MVSLYHALKHNITFILCHRRESQAQLHFIIIQVAYYPAQCMSYLYFTLHNNKSFRAGHTQLPYVFVHLFNY